MARLITNLALVACGVVASAQSSDLAALKEQLAKTELALERCQAQSRSLSVFEVVGHAYEMGKSVVTHLLDKTSVDEQVVDALSQGVAKCKDVAGKVSLVDYSSYVKQIKSHEAVASAQKALSPILDDHVHPVLAKATAHIAPAMQQAQEVGSQAVGQVMVHGPKKLDAARIFVGHLVAPIFETLGKISPRQKSELPVQPLDRVLFIVVATILLYYLVYFSLLGCRFSKKIVRVALKLPFKLAKFALGTFFWVATGFYCCGLCRSKKPKPVCQTKDVKNSKTDNNSVPAISVGDLKKLLDEGKKENKLEAAAKQLAALAKSGKPMTTPKHLAGKKVTKEALKEAVAKFPKELDIKKLNL